MLSVLAILERRWNVDGAAEGVLVYRVRGISSSLLGIDRGGWVDGVLVVRGVHASGLSCFQGLSCLEGLTRLDGLADLGGWHG